MQSPTRRSRIPPPRGHNGRPLANIVVGSTASTHACSSAAQRRKGDVDSVLPHPCPPLALISTDKTRTESLIITEVTRTVSRQSVERIAPQAFVPPSSSRLQWPLSLSVVFSIRPELSCRKRSTLSAGEYHRRESGAVCCSCKGRPVGALQHSSQGARSASSLVVPLDVQHRGFNMLHRASQMTALDIPRSSVSSQLMSTVPAHLSY